MEGVEKLSEGIIRKKTEKKKETLVRGRLALILITKTRYVILSLFLPVYFTRPYTT